MGELEADMQCPRMKRAIMTCIENTLWMAFSVSAVVLESKGSQSSQRGVL